MGESPSPFPLTNNNKMDTQEIRKAASYLRTVNALTKQDEAVLTIALNRVANGQPLSESVRKNTEDLLFLYRGLAR